MLSNSGRDMHLAKAAEMFGVPECDVTPEQRRYAKQAAYAEVYGSGPLRLPPHIEAIRKEPMTRNQRRRSKGRIQGVRTSDLLDRMMRNIPESMAAPETKRVSFWRRALNWITGRSA